MFHLHSGFFFYYILLFKLKARTINSFKAERETLLQEIAVILNTEEKIQVTVFRFIILLVKERAITRRFIFYMCDTEKKTGIARHMQGKIGKQYFCYF